MGIRSHIPTGAPPLGTQLGLLTSVPQTDRQTCREMDGRTDGRTDGGQTQTTRRDRDCSWYLIDCFCLRHRPINPPAKKKQVHGIRLRNSCVDFWLRFLISFYFCPSNLRTLAMPVVCTMPMFSTTWTWKIFKKSFGITDSSMNHQLADAARSPGLPQTTEH